MEAGDAKGDTPSGAEARAEVPVAPPKGSDPPSRPARFVPNTSVSRPLPLSQAVINTMCGQGMQAMSYLEASAFIYTNGCIDKLVNWIHSNLFLLGGIALGLAVPQVPGLSPAGDWEGEKGPSCGSTLSGSCLNGVIATRWGVGAGFGVGGAMRTSGTSLPGGV